jgi:cardiolipin synthase A/B
MLVIYMLVVTGSVPFNPAFIIVTYFNEVNIWCGRIILFAAGHPKSKPENGEIFMLPHWISELVHFVVRWIPVINLFFAAVIIFLERRNAVVAWAWLILLLFVPFFGFIIYLLFGQNLARQKVYKMKPKIDPRIREDIKSLVRKMKAGDLEYKQPGIKDYQPLIYMNLISSYSLLSENNEVTLYTDGQDKLRAIMEEIERAEKHIHLLYYKIGNDETGRKVIEALTDKASEGVEVRVLYDDIGSPNLSREVFRELEAAGGKAYPFFASKIRYLNFRVNYRNHRKFAIFDGRIGFIGGFNLGNEYVGLDPKYSYWRDTHLKIQGDAVHRIQVQFLMDWSIPSSEAIVSDLSYYPKIQTQGNTAVQIVSSGPASDKQQIKFCIIKLISEAKRRIYLQTPYFVPDDSVLTALKVAVSTGVDVHIMIPKKSDSLVVEWATYSYMEDLLIAGAHIYLYKKGFLHAKTMVVDGRVSSVGTANMDYRSFELNFETNAVLYDVQVAGQLEDIFEKDLEDCELLTLSGYKSRSHLTRMAESVARLLSPIL